LYNFATQYIVKTCDIDKDAVLLRPGKLRGMFVDAGFDKVHTRTIIYVTPIGQFLSGVDSVLGGIFLSELVLFQRREVAALTRGSRH